MTISAKESAIQPTVETQVKESRIQPVWHVFVLTLLTAGIYLPFWLYKNCRDLSKRASEPTDDSPDSLKPLTINEADALRYIKRCWPLVLAVGALLPFVGAFVLAFFFRTIAQIFPDTESPLRKHSLTTGVFLMLLTYAASAAARLPDAFYLLYLTIVFPIAVAQHWLNRYWQSVEPQDILVRHSFSTGELVLLIFGIMLTGMLILHFFFGVV